MATSVSSATDEGTRCVCGLLIDPKGPRPLPGMVGVLSWGWRCERCSHEWLPRGDVPKPKVCPACKSPYWDKPRRAGNWPEAKRRP